MTQKRTFLFLALAAALFYAQQLPAQLIQTFAGNGFGASTGTGGYTGDGGQATLAELNSCTGVGFDGAGNIYIADWGNNVVRKVNAAGIISTFAGTGAAGYSGDGGNAASAKLNKPYSVAADMAGNVYISDYGNNVVRIVSPGGIISTYAGNNTAGYSGDNGYARSAQLSGPEGLAIDSSGNLFIAEAGNNVVREVFTDSIINTFAGTGTFGYSGDGGQAVYAQLHGPAGVATDIYGNVYIADYYNNVVRKVNTSGVISTFAGTGLAGYTGDGGAAAAAELHYPCGVAAYGFGAVYIADQNTNTVRMVNASGVISTFAGTGTNGYRGDEGNANAAELSSPKGVAVDALQRVFIADYDNNVIRVVYANTPAAVKNIAATGNEFSVYPNPSTGAFTIELPATGANAAVTVTDVLGRCIETRTIDAATASKADLSFNVPAGSYIVEATAGDKNYKAQVVVIK